MTAIPFYIDLKSPYSYVAAHRGLALARAGRLQFDWRPFTLDIGSRTGSPGWRNRARYVYRDVRRFATPLGLTIRGPKEVYNSSVAQIGLLYAKQCGDVCFEWLRLEVGRIRFLAESLVMLLRGRDNDLVDQDAGNSNGVRRRGGAPLHVDPRRYWRQW